MKEFKVLVFRIKNELFATDIMEVERILGYTEPTEIPDSPSFLKGVIKYEKEVIPVIDLYDKFKFNNSNENSMKRIVVVKKDKGNFGIIVDDVSEVTTISNDIIESPNSINAIISKRYIKGIVKDEKALIILLDLNAILSRNEEELIFEGV